ncbi:Histidine kinase, part of a two-component phosphorelay system involved in signal transduction [Trichoderma guizhouense]|uniref:histidine kinase n=1 Tax=Trichoderma guizhouense TaxID=1491466 RepID=A0A1T3CN18_9HYPO|nr:Histidine kinase, part of a two-component phosphorelay system involved in signal transduction [Trichoderma guizhouense]
MAAIPDRAQVKAAKLVSESARERETFEYSSSLLSAVRLNETGKPTPSSELATADDVILTGLAQLGALQTGTDRSLISLFDAHRQCIVAEATPTQRLYPSLKSDDCDRPLWLCGTAIPRSHGICELSLLGDKALDAADGETPNQLPLTIAHDLVTDPRFSEKPYCQPGTLARFYAAVPIRTRRGINIGVYCVINETPNKTWTDAHSQHLRDISWAIMDHLEAQRLKVVHKRDLRMNRGLGSFIEGKATIYGGQKSSHDVVLETVPNSPSHRQRFFQQQQQDIPEDDLVTDLSPKTTLTDPIDASRPGNEANLSPNDAISGHERRTFSAGSSGSTRPEFKSMANLTEDESSMVILSKAANIVRESIEVEGCLFFEAPIQSYLSPAAQNSTTTDDGSQSSATSSSDEDLEARRPSKTASQCRLLGFSTSTASSINGAIPSRPCISLRENFLSKLLRRYPRGQIFNFGADGELQSDSSEDEQPWQSSEAYPNVSPLPFSYSEINLAAPRVKSSARQLEGKALLKAFPGSRSIGFVPIWDPRKDRWHAGGFICTKDVARSFSLEQELSYLRALGMLAMSEILRFKDLRADKAKTDALGSLSHELRSPLHGILLNAELLIDTKLDIFQGNVAHTIETCSRTLLDTVDHLLEYSRINHLSGRDDRALSLTANGLDLGQFGKKSLLRDSQIDHIVEEVIESVFAGFNFLHLSVKQLSDQHSGSINSDVNANHHSDSLQAIDQLEPWMTKNGELRWSFDDVLIILSMDARCNWAYCVDVGAIRRIVMNIFGNALKHTKRGTITVSLTQEMVRLRGRKKERVVRFTVQDTGKGIGPDFLKHGLFRPFSQEDPLSPGAGLGLSLVQQITSHLQGDVSIRSELGVGTTACVTLPLEQLPRPVEVAPTISDEEDKAFKEQVADLKGLRVRVIMANSDWQTAIVNTCREWLHMEIIPNTRDTSVTPDLVLWSHMDMARLSEDFESFDKTPNVVVCSNALQAYRQSHMFKKAASPAIFEFISQPTGPRKLARTLHSASQTETPPKSPEESLVRRDKPAAPQISFLLVDDNYINLRVLSTYMKKRNIGFQEAKNGKEAVDYFLAHPGAYACILMDISMPVMDGFEATRQIRAHEAQMGLTPVPIIALSGLATEDAQQEAFGSGMDVFLTKPVKLGALGNLLESHGILNSG